MDDLVCVCEVDRRRAPGSPVFGKDETSFKEEHSRGGRH